MIFFAADRTQFSQKAPETIEVDRSGMIHSGDPYDHLGKFHHDQSLFSRSLEIMARIRESSPNGRTIQVSEIV